MITLAPLIIVKSRISPFEGVLSHSITVLKKFSHPRASFMSEISRFVYPVFEDEKRSSTSMASDRRAVSGCDCKACNEIRSRLNKIFVVLETYGWLLDTYIVDFFVDDVWDKLPPQWRNTLGDINPEELGNWVKGKKSSTRVWPLSLLALQETIKSLEINREHENRETLSCSGLEKRKFINCQSESADSMLGTKRKHIDPEHQKLFTKSVKKKKRHEIENIAETTSKCAEVAKCECIVDVGAGMGHLARTLAYNYGLCVVCLEQDESLSKQAKNFDERLFGELKKKMPNILVKNPRHISTKIVESDVLGEELMEKLKNEFSNNFALDKSKRGFGLIGLHTCGDLAANLIRLYSQQSEIAFICIVGCCYMKITCGIKDTGSFGYPLSNYVSMKKNHKFSYAALEVACHAIENYCDKLVTGEYKDLLVHAYRATLETILVGKSGITIRRSHLKNVKLKENMTFKRYCTAATENLHPENRPDPKDFETVDVKKCLGRWRQVVAFGTLRFLLAPLVESAVLFDRFLYLSEKNLLPSLHPIFDPRISPRNIILTSCK